jgi:predicted transcriptional regulator
MARLLRGSRSVTLFMPEELRSQAARLARAEDRSLSSVIRVAVSEHLARRGTQTSGPPKAAA